MKVMEKLDAICETRQKWVRDAFLTREKVAPYAASIDSVIRLLGDKARLDTWEEKTSIRMNVLSMDESIPVIESLEAIIGKEFDKSSDETSYTATRTFEMSSFPLKLVIDVSGNNDDASCKAVQVGEKIVPVFEIRCDKEG